MFRAVILDNDGFSPVEIKNNTFAQRGSDEVIEVNTQSVDIIEAMRQSKYIYEKDLGNNISSFNFTREAFLKGKWDDITTKARGLFVNVATKEVVARSYEKFFNLGERDETKVENLRRTMQFPAVAYMKINGYLGIVGYNSEDDSLFVATKSTNQGEYQKWFYDILSSTEHFDQLKDFLKENNVSMVFEVVDPVNDPHIIKYNHPHVVLLDVVYRTFEFQKYAYPDLIAVANYFRFYCKPVVDVFNNWAEFYAFVESAENDYEFGRINGSRFEGVVVERADGFQFKIKFLYYKTWKMLRGLKDVVARRRQVHTEWLNTPTQNRFYAWVKSIADLDFVKNTDIITLRDMYLSDGGSE
jgi:tRNA splicing ligase